MTIKTKTPYKLKNGKKYMNEEQLDRFRNVLRLWKQQLEEDYMRDEAAIYSDPLDRDDPVKRVVPS